MEASVTEPTEGITMTVIPLHRDAVLPELGLPAGSWHGRIWVTRDAIADSRCYSDCVGAYQRCGLWPVLIPPDDRFASVGQDWLDDRGFLPRDPQRAATADPAAVLTEWWPGPCCSAGCLEPIGPAFPGLARASGSRADRFAEAAESGSLLAAARNYRLGLVPVRRPADVPAELGWSGMENFTEDVGALSAVLRSWEDRFGAVLVVLGFDALELAVASPPTTPGGALAVAAEHRAFCPDTFDSQRGTIRDVARGLIHRPLWRFWWD